MEFQKENQFGFKNEGGIKGYFKAHKYQKFMIAGGVVAAAAETFGFSNGLTYLVTLGGVAAGALAIGKITNSENKVSTSAFLAVGGLALTAITNFLPFENILDQGGQAVLVAGVAGLAYAGYKKVTGQKVKM
jgi:hypothetical protein